MKQRFVFIFKLQRVRYTKTSITNVRHLDIDDEIYLGYARGAWKSYLEY